MNPDDRVAIVVVHGIADQQPGQTVRELARLLCHGGGDAPRYVQGEMHDVLVPVGKLEPGGAASQPAAPAPPGGDGRKAETARKRPGTPGGFYQAQRAAGVPAADVAPAWRADGKDLGIALHDYLLGRLELPEDEALYESTRASLRRQANDRPVDLYELYWADLSRLGTGGVRALTALYQLFFHLNTLAADIVDQASLRCGGGARWRLQQWLHAWLAWLMKGPAALLQLSMLLLALFGAVALVPATQEAKLMAALFAAGAIACLALAVLGGLRPASRVARGARLAVFLAAALACAMMAVVALREGVHLLWIHYFAGVLAVVVPGIWLVRRYGTITHGVRLLGHCLVVASAAGLLVDGWWLLSQSTTQAEWMLTAALNVGECLLATFLLAWAAFVVVQIAALVLGLWLAGGADDDVRRSMATTRVAVVGSSALFAVLSLVLWSVIGYVAGHGLAGLYYEPLLFGSGYRTADIFLDARVGTLGGFFTPLMIAFAALAGATLLMLAPSLAEELSPTHNLDARGPLRDAGGWSQRLGRWLDCGQRWLRALFLAVVAPGAILGGVLYLAFVAREFAFPAGAASAVVQWIAGWLDHLQGETLVAAGKWLAGGALTLAALGSRFTQTVGRLRVAIDAVLDVDNYFGDPPSRRPPRARIFSRYASLLAYLRECGYARIVIVSHSQGTVISADLLRYLHVQGRLSGLVGGVPVALVTVGSPLRDLYAERFPLAYGWMGPATAPFEAAVPSAADIGAEQWVNACRSGDYVGRYLWTPAGGARHYAVAAVGADGKVEAQRAGDRVEFCLGAGGHTHYFSNDALALAVEIDRLVEG
ncbi:MAG TPA: hypothetical protein VFV71_04325 [Burkholderiales bacterium]|nr:hypothetical protein [Burkholderiales bacterium]